MCEYSAYRHWKDLFYFLIEKLCSINILVYLTFFEKGKGDTDNGKVFLYFVLFDISNYRAPALVIDAKFLIIDRAQRFNMAKPMMIPPAKTIIPRYLAISQARLDCSPA